MGPAARLLSELQSEIVLDEDSDLPLEYLPRLTVLERAGCVLVDYFGNPFQDAYHRLTELLASEAVAPALAALILRGPDEGANGTRNWDLSRLILGTAPFDQLSSVLIEQNKLGDHNRTIVGTTYDEEGQIARLLAKSRHLSNLTVPSAPDAAFFGVGERPLRHLSVDAGYDTQEFILNLARSDAFPNLSSLEFGDYAETYMDDYAARCTPVEHFEQLFSSETMTRIRRLVLRNPALSTETIRKLRGQRSDLQMMIVRSSADYVR